MRIKVAISNYGTSQLEYLKRVVDEFKKNKRHRLDITVHTTVPVEYPHVLHDHSLGFNLTFTHRKEMILALPEYDLFIYNENDHLITEDNIEAFLEHSRGLADGEVSGFIQYEIGPKARKTLVALNPLLVKGSSPVEGKTQTSWRPKNKHQGCWILLQKDLDKAIRSGGFTEKPHSGPYGVLEQGASDPYLQCGLTKVYPADYRLCERLLIHHLPDKYVKTPGWEKVGADLKGFFEEHLRIPIEGGELGQAPL